MNIAFGHLRPLSWFKAELQPDSAKLFIERRATKRERIEFKAEMEGSAGTIRSKGLDIHAGGAMVLCDKPWTIGTTVFVRLKDFGMGCVAEVRYCTQRKKGNFVVGLKFKKPPALQIGDWFIERASRPADD